MTAHRPELTFRRYYKKVPTLRKDDNVLPPASEIPAMLSNSRKRTISIGPQSEADVREYIANREQKRRESLSSGVGARLKAPHSGDLSSSPFRETADGHLSPAPASSASSIRQYQQHQARESLQAKTSERETPSRSPNDTGKEDELQDRKMFSALEKPRIRYDVEVITKVVVYAGIGWLAVEVDPLLFKWLGLA